MLTKYIDAAMKRAQYELIEDQERPYFGTIPGFRIVWANAATLEACREELKAVLEDWILFKLWHNETDFPVLGKLTLVPSRGLGDHESGIKTRTRKAS